MELNHNVLLESIRHDDVGNFFIWFRRVGNILNNNARLYYFTPIFSHRAFYSSLNSLSEYENAVDIRNNNTSAMSVVLWFIALESYINTLLKCVCILKNIQFSSFKKMSVCQRINLISKHTGVDIFPLKTSKLVAQIDEFCSLRNDLLHDSFMGVKKIKGKTLFSTIPYHCNQVDVMQAAKISISLMTYFSNIFPGITMMPQVGVELNGKVYFVGLDRLYEKLLSVYFLRILNKHGHGTKLKCQIDIVASNGSSLCAKGDVTVVVKAKREVDIPFAFNNSVTSMYGDLMEVIRSEILECESDKFTLPNYIVN